MLLFVALRQAVHVVDAPSSPLIREGMLRNLLENHAVVVLFLKVFDIVNK